MDLRVPKKKVLVNMHLADDSVVSGDIFLDLYSPSHDGEESIIDFFNLPTPFIPVSTGGGSSIRLINKSTVCWITAVDSSKEGEEEEKDEFGTTTKITAVLTNGKQFTGNLIIHQSASKSRTLDFFNAVEKQFFEMGTSTEVIYINIRYICQVLPEQS